MPDPDTLILLFLAGCAAWTISTFSGGAGSIILLALATHVIRITQAAPVVTVASLMASPARIATSWRLIEWRVVRWYLPGAMLGAVGGSWLLSSLPRGWITLVVGAFLVSTPFQYRFGTRARSFRMPLPGFIPVSIVVGVVSGLTGASSLISLPFYLNFGLAKERLIATGAVHSLFIQLTKVATYTAVGVLGLRSLAGGIAAGTGAVLAIYGTRRLLERLDDTWFRRFAVILMLTSGALMLWNSRDLLHG